MLEAERDESRDREDDRQDVAGHFMRREAQPDREADQDVAENAAEERLAEAERDLGLADPNRGLGERAVVQCAISTGRSA